MPDLSDNELDPIEPPQLRFLRRLVTVLTAVMIGGIVLTITLLVIRLNDRTPMMPDALTLPAGAAALTVTAASDWVGVLTDQDEFLIFDRMTGQLRQTIKIDAAADE